MGGLKMKNMTFKMDDGLHVRFKIVSIRKGKTMAEILNKLVGAYVKKAEKEAEKKGG
jgi:predicted DNA-binding protein